MTTRLTDDSLVLRASPKRLALVGGLPLAALAAASWFWEHSPRQPWPGVFSGLVLLCGAAFGLVLVINLAWPAKLTLDRSGVGWRYGLEQWRADWAHIQGFGVAAGRPTGLGDRPRTPSRIGMNYRLGEIPAGFASEAAFNRSRSGFDRSFPNLFQLDTADLVALLERRRSEAGRDGGQLARDISTH